MAGKKRKSAKSIVIYGGPNDPYAGMSGKQIRSFLESIGAFFEATDTRSWQYQTLLRAEKKFENKKRLTNAEKLQLASERRRFLSGASRSTEKIPENLRKFHAQEVRLSKKTTGRDLATDAEAALKREHKRGNYNARVFWIPDDPTKLHKKFDDFENFKLFVRRSYYRGALAAELKAGRFVVGTLNPETRTIREDSSGKPIIDAELGKKVKRDTRKKVARNKTRTSKAKRGGRRKTTRRVGKTKRSKRKK